MEFLLEIYVNKNLLIPDHVIRNEINDANRLFILYVTLEQYNLFDPEIVKTVVGDKSARNI